MQTLALSIRCTYKEAAYSFVLITLEVMHQTHVFLRSCN